MGLFGIKKFRSPVQQKQLCLLSTNVRASPHDLSALSFLLLLVQPLARDTPMSSYGFFTKASAALRRRDPNEKVLRFQSTYLNMMKRYAAVVIGIIVVCGETTYDQLRHPEKVRVPRQDGRSLVT